MKQIVKGAVIGAICGVAAPVGLAVANEVLFAQNKYNDITAARICFAERTWSLFRLDIKYAKGCKNGLLDSVPLCLVIGVLGGSLIGALSLVSKNKVQKTPDQPAPPAVAPQEPVAASSPEQTPDPVERSLKDAPKPSLPSIAPQVSQGLEQLKGLNWNKIGKGAAVAGVVVLAYTQLNPSSTNMPGSPGGNENKLFNSKIQRRITIIDSANEYGYWGTYDRTRLTYTRSTYEICKEKLGALSNSELDDLLANGAKVVGNASNVYDKTIETPFTNGMGGTTMGYLVCQIKDYVIEE